MADTARQDVEKTAAPDSTVARWVREIDAYDKAMQGWTKRGKEITKRYADQNEQSDQPREARRFAILWSNVETIRPALYARTPQATASRRYKDNDPIAKQASEILERALNYSLDANDFDGTLQDDVQDLLLPGRGSVWVRYEPSMKTVTPPPDPLTGEQPEPFEQLDYERVLAEYVDWRDFGHTVARTWREVWAVWRRSYLTKEQLQKRFPKTWSKIPLNHKPVAEGQQGSTDAPSVTDKAEVFEIWSKRDRKVFFIVKGMAEPAGVEDPFLHFDGFFPCPRPIYSSRTTKSLIPTPDYVYYQDQAEEIDKLTERIGKLGDALKLAGVYPADDKGSNAIERLLDPTTDNILIPIDSWAAWAERGGVKGVIEWLPIDMVVEVLKGCIEARKQLIEDVYQITGISDILRGVSEASETATAQNIKSQWGSLRIRDRQKEVARFARDTIRLMGEVIAEVFQPETLQQMTGMQVTDEVMALLRNNMVRCFRIDIETDSTIEPNEEEQKKSATEFVAMVGQFLQQAGPIAAQAPQMMPMMGEMLMFAVRNFRAGRSLEDVIEQTMGAMAQQAMQPKPPAPDPNMVKVQGQLEADKQRMGMEQQMQAHEMQLKEQAQNHDMALKERQTMLNAAIKAAQPAPQPAGPRGPVQ
ncbi:hypothetical protein [Inquilinus sp.]|uniref:hypothetical protein n=1 Tax=Inquilinus sp. TaxID=1932117 RepID=UPI0031DAD019